MLPTPPIAQSRLWLIDALNRGRTKSPFDLWAQLIMPEHVHLVVLPKAGARFSSILSTIKKPVTNCAVCWLKHYAPRFLETIADVQPSGKRCYRFWQRGGGYDRNLRSVRDIHEKIRYVHENPVRRGLVGRAVDWPWSGARAWETGDDEPLAIDRDRVPRLTVLDDDQASRLMH